MTFETSIAGGMLALAATVSAAASPACFTGCMADRPPASDDYFAYSADAKACRDRCDAEAIRRLEPKFRPGSCRAEALSRDEFRALRAASPPWRAQFNVFSWEVENVLPDKVLVEVTVQTQDINLVDVELTAAGAVPPGGRGTFVIPDFFDGYPAVRYATRVTGARACRVR